MNNFIYDSLFNGDEELIKIYNSDVYFRNAINALDEYNDPAIVIKDLCTIISNNNKTIGEYMKNQPIQYVLKQII
jgi:hypothetical protein